MKEPLWCRKDLLLLLSKVEEQKNNELVSNREGALLDDVV